MRIITKKYRKALCFFIIVLLLCSCSLIKDNSTKDYGVFLNLESENIDKIDGYSTVVIDAQYYSQKDIMNLKKQGSKVYSYLNIGSIEKFRDYYDTYKSLALGDYENWEGEHWINVSSPLWQKFLISLEEDLLKKNIDGFFIDNCDVYYEYPTDDIFEGLTAIMKHLKEYNKPIIINGGDAYVMKYLNMYGSLHQIITGVNQECVLSKINFKTGEFTAQSKKSSQYFKSYIETCKKNGIDVYLLEYTTDIFLKKKVKDYCRINEFHYYISDSIELD